MLDELINENLSEEEKIGINIVKKALISPLRQIAENAGIKDISIIVDDVQKKEHTNIGYDFTKTDFTDIKRGRVDMLEAGIVDPVKVTRSALQNAASMASIFLTTEAVITDIPEEKKDGGIPPMEY